MKAACAAVLLSVLPVKACDPPAPVETVEVRSSAYCLTGRMANGERAHRGAVAANRWKIGTRLRVRGGPAGEEYVVKDRHRQGATELDFALPGSCREAIQWGRRSVVVEVLG